MIDYTGLFIIFTAWSFYGIGIAGVFWFIGFMSGAGLRWFELLMKH